MFVLYILYVCIDSDSSSEKEKEKEKEMGIGININSNPKNENISMLNKNDGLSKAAKMMAKQGWKEGEGLGKKKQGLKGCLVPVGNYNTLVSVQDASNVMRLQNMVGRGEIDDELKPETIKECEKYGKVLDCIIYEEKNNKNVSDEYAKKGGNLIVFCQIVTPYIYLFYLFFENAVFFLTLQT